MSIRIMSLIWERAPQQGGALLTLLALADWANDEGECWPSIPKLADKARQSERNVRYILRDLEAEGFLTVQPGGGLRHPNHYQLNLPKLQTLQPLHGSVQILQPLQGLENVTLQTATANPANSDSKPCKLQPASSDPSGDPPEIQPSAPAREDGKQGLAAPGGEEGKAPGASATVGRDSADAPDAGWHTCPDDFFAHVQDLIAHPRAPYRSREPPAPEPAETGGAP